MVAQPADGAGTERTGTRAEQIQQLYADAESKAGEAMEGLVASNGFAELLSLLTSNVVALVKVGGETADAVIRAARLAGRSDVARLSRQLARTEDKLELVLQELRALQAEEGAAQPVRRRTARSKP